MSEPTKYEGLSGALRTSPWLAGEDLIGLGEVEVEIAEVFMYDSVTFNGGRKEANVPTLAFVGKQKQLVLRTGANRKTLVRTFGADTRKWRGQKIKLYFDPNVEMPKGTKVGGIRIKAT